MQQFPFTFCYVLMGPNATFVQLFCQTTLRCSGRALCIGTTTASTDGFHSTEWERCMFSCRDASLNTRRCCFSRAYKRCANSNVKRSCSEPDPWNGVPVTCILFTFKSGMQWAASTIHGACGTHQMTVVTPVRTRGRVTNTDVLAQWHQEQNLILIPTLFFALRHSFHLFLSWSPLRHALKYRAIINKPDLSLVERNTICWTFKDHTHYSAQLHLSKSCCLTLTFERNAHQELDKWCPTEKLFLSSTVFPEWLKYVNIDKMFVLN